MEHVGGPQSVSPGTPVTASPSLPALADPAHQARVARIAAALRARSERRRAGQDAGFASLGKAQVSHMVPAPRDPRHGDAKVDARDLNHILAIDPAARTCTAESGVAFCDLVQATLRHGLLPTLVPELKTITIGGAVSGCSVESMSYRLGGFHDGCLAYEAVTGRGDILHCTRDSDPELFHRLHGSYGTLGLLTALTFSLVPAKPFVHLTYRRHSSFHSFLAAARARIAAADYDFIDGIIHGPSECVLCLGRFVDHAPVTSDYSGAQIFYKSTRQKSEDYLTTFDYLFRYDTECHWLTRTLPGLEIPLVRRLLGPYLLGSTNLLTWSQRLRPLLRWQQRPPVVVDVFIPDARAEEFLGWYQREFDFYPLWVVPYLVPAGGYPWLNPARSPGRGEGLYFDFAVYGKLEDRPGIWYSELLEQKTRELGGIKTLISRNHYDEATFWSIYDRPGYQAVKQRTDPDNLLRDLYQKFAPGARR